MCNSRSARAGHKGRGGRSCGPPKRHEKDTSNEPHRLEVKVGKEVPKGCVAHYPRAWRLKNDIEVAVTVPFEYNRGYLDLDGEVSKMPHTMDLGVSRVVFGGKKSNFDGPSAGDDRGLQKLVNAHSPFLNRGKCHYGATSAVAVHFGPEAAALRRRWPKKPQMAKFAISAIGNSYSASVQIHQTLDERV